MLGPTGLRSEIIGARALDVSRLLNASFVRIAGPHPISGATLGERLASRTSICNMVLARLHYPFAGESGPLRVQRHHTHLQAATGAKRVSCGKQSLSERAQP